MGALTREAVDKEIPKLKPKEKKLEATNRLVSAEEEMPDWKEREILIAQGYLNELLFIDTTLMYGRGKEHPYKASCTRIILEIATGSFQENLRLTDTEVLQEILYQYALIGKWETGISVCRDFFTLGLDILPIGSGEVL
ncbi:hypothetical protein M1N81_03160 [Dehalococcoidia bacterium]|nr:hypothetical protein [Dehalococcoidia bacterium]